MTRLRSAVIGAGYLGRFHAQKYQLIDSVDLIAVCDINPQNATALAQELGLTAYHDYTALFGQVDLVSIAASTKSHYQIAKAFLSKGVHVLLEKPMTETLAQAQELIDIAQDLNLILQIGHLERFNPVRLALDEYLDRPFYIDAQRLAPFTPRGADVNVVLDLMIHDIDLVQSMVKSPILSIEAHGTSVLSSTVDIANARIKFANQCTANFMASRVSATALRKTRIFQASTYISLDYQQKKLAITRKNQGNTSSNGVDCGQQLLELEANDALLEEIKAFVDCVQTKRPALVCGEAGRDALATAIQISELITENLAAHALA